MAIKFLNEHWTVTQSGRTRPKYGYSDYYKALYILNKHHNKEELHVYKCGFCGKYHIGHKLNPTKPYSPKKDKKSTRMDKNKLYDAAIKNYGSDKQMDQAEEECLELSLALRHFKRSKATEEDVITEIADVTIMCQQLARIFGRRKVKDEIDRKRKRQAERLLAKGYITQEEFNQIIAEDKK